MFLCLYLVSVRACLSLFVSVLVFMFSSILLGSAAPVLFWVSMCSTRGLTFLSGARFDRMREGVGSLLLLEALCLYCFYVRGGVGHVLLLSTASSFRRNILQFFTPLFQLTAYMSLYSCKQMISMSRRQLIA